MDVGNREVVHAHIMAYHRDYCTEIVIEYAPIADFSAYCWQKGQLPWAWPMLTLL